MCRRPAVSMTQTSAPPSTACLTASKATAAGSAPSGPVTTVGADAVAPGLQLLARGRAEGVGRAEHHAATVGHEHPGELAGGGGLAGAVDADDEHDRRVLGVGVRGERCGPSWGRRARAAPRAAARGHRRRRVTPSARVRVCSALDQLLGRARRRGRTASRVSSTSSQVASSSWSRVSRASRPLPTAVFERASRARRRPRRPARGLGRLESEAARAAESRRLERPRARRRRCWRPRCGRRREVGVRGGASTEPRPRPRTSPTTAAAAEDEDGEAEEQVDQGGVHGGHPPIRRTGQDLGANGFDDGRAGTRLRSAGTLQPTAGSGGERPRRRAR